MDRSRIASTRRRGNFRKGNAILECAVTLIVLMNLTFGSVEFSYFFYVKNMFSDAARQGARTGAPSTSTNAAVTSAVTAALASTGWPAANYTVSITDTSGNSVDVSTVTQGTAIQVKISAAWGTIGAGFRPLSLIPAGKQAVGVAVFRKEG